MYLISCVLAPQEWPDDIVLDGPIPGSKIPVLFA
jgi:hypothetical protein